MNNRKYMNQHQKSDKRDEELEQSEILVETPRPRIPPGEYDAICFKVNNGRSWGGRRDCYLRFRIYDGNYNGTELFMVCPFPPGKLSTRMKLYAQWTLAMMRQPRKGERICTKDFLNKLYRVEVRDTKRKFPDSNKVLPKFMQYSVVATILDVLAGVSQNDIQAGNHEQNNEYY
jgi:hypothetical protein